MYVLNAKIEIQGDRLWQVRFVSSVEITRDTEKLTDECKITLPKRLKWDGQAQIPVKRGDSVKVWTGYGDSLELSFVGYVRSVSVKTPVVLTCEDEMFQLKQKACTKKAYKSVTLETLLKDQGLSGAKVFGEQALGQFRVTDETVAALLGRLQDSGIRSFYRYENGSPVLYCGVIFERDTKPSQVFATGLNIINDSNLEQQQAENIRLHVKAVSIMPDNKKIKVEVGDADGERRTLHTYNKTESELKAWAEQEIKRLKVDGLTGSFTTFGYKLVDKLDAVGIKIDGNKMGVYQVKKNVVKFGTNGYRQEITLGMRVAQ
nr:MAG TPA: tail protein [Caudoviricetes sp.]